MEARGQLGVAVVLVAIDHGFLDCPVHPLDLAVGPGMLDPILAAAHVEHVGHVGRGGAISVARWEGELDAVIGQHRMDLVGYDLDHGDQESRSRSPTGLRNKLDAGKLAGPVDRHIEIEPAFGFTQSGDIDVEVADRIGLELALRLLAACHLGQPAAPVLLHAAMQGLARQVGRSSLARRKASHPEAAACACGKRR